MFFRDLYFNYVKDARSIGISVKVIPIENYKTPDVEAFTEIHKYLNEIKQKNEPLVVHCLGGKGRTGLVLALYLMIFYKKSAKDAIYEVRSAR